MKVRLIGFATFGVAVFLIAGVSARAASPLTPAQKKELSAIRGDLTRVHTPIRHDLIDQSEKKVNEAEQRLDTFVKDAGIGDSDSHIVSIRRLIAARRTAIEKARAKEAQKKESGEVESRPKKGTAKEKGGGFVFQVAPIFVKHCLDCHGADAKGGLRLDTYAGMEKGGKSGPLLQIGDAESSLLMARLTAAGDARMPKGGEPLSEAECKKIAEWINRGAKFDGDDPTKPLAQLTAGVDRSRKTVAVKIFVPRPTGNETVSFTKDIAPFMVERCLRCHSGSDPKGKLSLETFESLLSGGKTGAEVVPGSLEKSRLWALVGEQKPFKMPPGDAFIKRAHWNSLRHVDSGRGQVRRRRREKAVARSRADGIGTADGRAGPHIASGASRTPQRSAAKSSGAAHCPRTRRRRWRTTHSWCTETFRPSGSSRLPSGPPRLSKRLRRSSTIIRSHSKAVWRSL